MLPFTMNSHWLSVPEQLQLAVKAIIPTSQMYTAKHRLQQPVNSQRVVSKPILLRTDALSFNILSKPAHFATC